MASARRVGTNEQVTTYDTGGGQTYTVLATWEAATDTDHVADEETDVLEWFRGNHADFAVMIPNDSEDNDADYHRIMRPASGEGNHGGICRVSANYASFTSSNGFQGISCRENYSQIQDLVGANDNESFNGGIFRPHGDASFSAYVGCMAVGRAGSGITEYGVLSTQRTDSDEVFVIDCAFQDMDNIGVSVATDGAIVNSYNTTVEGSDSFGFHASGSGTHNVKNGLSDNIGSDYGGSGTVNLTTCSSGDGTGSVGLQNQTYSFVDVNNGDLHINISTDGDDDGTDLSGDTDYAFDDDIDKVTITNWPCGYDEPIAAPSGVLLRNLTLMGAGR